jgi:hypothetical protein
VCLHKERSVATNGRDSPGLGSLESDKERRRRKRKEKQKSTCQMRQSMPGRKTDVWLVKIQEKEARTGLARKELAALD